MSTAETDTGGAGKPGTFRDEFLSLAWKAAATLLTTAGFLGLVALTGGAITWLRFFAAELPADQAVAAFPRGELIVVGAAALTTFTILGLVAVVAVYVLDHGGRPTDGMRRGLVLLATVEVWIALAVASEETRVDSDALWLAAVLGGVVGAALMLASYYPESENRLARLRRWLRFDSLTEERELPPAPASRSERAEALAAASAEADAARAHASAAEAQILAGVPNASGGVREAARAAAAAAAHAERAAVAVRVQPAEPTKARVLNDVGIAFELALVALYALALWRLATGWVAAAFLIAVGLGGLVYGVSRATGSRFLPYGIAVFFSVAVFGAVLSLFRIAGAPDVQPAALVRKGDPQNVAIQGIFITENKERVWLGSVAAKCGKNRSLAHSGRIYSIPKDQVESLAIGNVQKLEKARTTAPEMASALIAARAPQPAPKSVTAAPVKPRQLVFDEAVRGPPVTKLEPTHATPGTTVTATGEGFGSVPGSVTVGGTRALLRPAGWHDTEVRFTVPDDAGDGRVVVSCPGPPPSPLVLKKTAKPESKPTSSKAKRQAKRGHEARGRSKRGQRRRSGRRR